MYTLDSQSAEQLMTHHLFRRCRTLLAIVRMWLRNSYDS